MASDFQLHLGDCLQVMATMPDASVDCIVTDPPYGLSDHKPQDVIDCLRAWLNGEPYQPNKRGFMGKGWDGWVAGPEVWREALRVLRPGGHLLCFAGTRSMDLVSMAIRLAGFELRDSIGYAHDGGGAPLLAWTYGSGFPKSANVSKLIDKHLGAEREVIREYSDNGRKVPKHQNTHATWEGDAMVKVTAPATDAAKQYDGFGTNLKPAWEPIILARKPLSEPNIAANVLAHGTGGLNVDACRVGVADDIPERSTGLCGASKTFGQVSKAVTSEPWIATQGRWPANLILSDEAAELLDEQSGERPVSGAARKGKPATAANNGMFSPGPGNGTLHNDHGGASRYFKVVQPDAEDEPLRFFYTGKASRSDRNQGVEEIITWESVGLNQETEQLHQLAKGMSDDTMCLLEGYEWNTILSGNNITGQSQKDFNRTISILTRLITELRTFDFSPSSNTRGCILAAIREMTANGLNLAESVEHINQLIPNFTNGRDASLPGAVSAALTMLLKISALGRHGNTHSTVKPTALCRWLVRLICPPGGVVLDPFAGSGSTGKAAMLEGFSFIGIDTDAEYLAIASKRIEHARAQMQLPLLEAAGD